MFKVLSFFLLVICILFSSLFQTSKMPDHSVFYISGDNIQTTLNKDGSFKNSFILNLIENTKELKNRIQTGEYNLKNGDSLLKFLAKLFSHDVIIRKITFPEGYTVKKIIKKLNENKLLFGELKSLPEEGTLMPNTYFYTFGDQKISIISKMKNEMKKTIDKLKIKNNTALNMNEIIILASIIEKESGIIKERDIISSVFHNRLKIKMRLQSDPTVIYAISDGYGELERNLLRSDLFFKSPYNTYRNAGLPPTPICCPGEDALIAAMNPRKTNYIYFVTTKDRTGHIFTDSYKQHLKNIKNIKSTR